MARNSFNLRKHRPSPKFDFESTREPIVSSSFYGLEARIPPTYLQRDGPHRHVNDGEPPPYTLQATRNTLGNESTSIISPVVSIERDYPPSRSSTPHGDARVPILFNTWNEQVSIPSVESLAVPESIHESRRSSYEAILVDPYAISFSQLKTMITDVIVSNRPSQPYDWGNWSGGSGPMEVIVDSLAVDWRRLGVRTKVHDGNLQAILVLLGRVAGEEVLNVTFR
ncbi:MAG: hypothetical protein Q9187_006447 [Circinaria calcarea]